MILTLLVGTALAAEPTVSVEDGCVVARMHVDATEAEVRQVLQDAEVAQGLTPEVRTVEATKRGDCMLVDVETEGMWNPLHYKAVRCPTADGWKTELLSSDDFSALDAEWKLTPSNGGTQVEYRVRTEVESIPSALVRKGTERSVKQTLIALLAKVVKG